jgi:predicted transcriptional regulator
MTTHTPERTVVVSAWLEPDLARRLAEAAEASDRSKSAELRVALRYYLEQADTKEATA